MSVDWVTVAVGVLFMLNAWWVPHKVRDIRDRVTERGRDVERFERFDRGSSCAPRPQCAWSLASSWLSPACSLEDRNEITADDWD